MQAVFSHPSLLPPMTQDTGAPGRKPVRQEKTPSAEEQEEVTPVFMSL